MRIYKTRKDFTALDTAGTLIWETEMDEALAPDSSPPHRFAGWRS